ncbi:MAG: DUF1700 domain-containing protein [Candidatus Izimaplasma sp.]|nr:DUF1700 domain-containing protein [Candidatus Izimaplasma bacterium]
MNKLDFLRRLDRELGMLDKEEKKEILAFYEERFYSGTIYENKTEEEVISELESPEVIARNVLEEYGVSPKYVKTKEERYSGIDSSQLIIMILFDVFIVSWLIPSLYSIVVGIFSALLSYVSVIGLMVGARTIADEFLFAFSTGAYILLFIFGLLVLEVSIYVTKKIFIYHLNVLKINNREKMVKKLHKFSVEGWFKRHKTAYNIKNLLFVSAIIVMAYSGYHLFVKENRLINEFAPEPLTTETYTEDLTLDIAALESWDITTDLETLNVKIVPTLGTDVTITHTYSEFNDFELDIDTTNNTITVINDYPNTIRWGSITDLFTLFGEEEILIIEVPVDLILGDFDITTINGTVTLMDIEVKQLDINTSNGRIVLDDIVVGADVTLYTSNGEINIQDVVGQYELKATSSNGKIYIRNVEFSAYYLETSNGTINLANLNVDNQDGVILIADTSNGHIILEDVYVLDVTLNTSNGDIEYYNDDKSFVVDNLDTDTSNGNISTDLD